MGLIKDKRTGGNMNKKGMTLIEILIAVFLIGVISIAFLPSITSAYVNIINSRKYTKEVFIAQEEIEEIMEKARNTNGPVDPTEEGMANLAYLEKTIFGKVIHGYEITKQISTRNNMKTFISENRPDEYEVPIAENVNIIARNASGIIEEVYASDLDLRFNGSNDIKSSTSHLLLDTLYKWYISKEGFDPVISVGIDETEYGTRYPRWPDDYSLLPSITRNLSGIDPDHLKDRYLLFSVIPVARVGKYGSEVSSIPLWINGLPRIDNLALHLDAALIEGNPRVKEGVVSNVSEWKDLRRGITATNNTVEPTSQLIFLSGSESKYGEKYISTNGNSLVTNDSSNLKSDKATIFVVIRTGNGSSKILSKGDWSLNVENGNKIKFNDSSSFEISEGKHVITAQLGRNNSSRGYNLHLDGNPKLYNTSFRNKNNNSGVLTIGEKYNSKNADIYEIIIYNSLLTREECEEIEEYLYEKYDIELGTASE